jgi:hypothetical protein
MNQTFLAFDKEIFFVECRTGCSCCASENHHRGPFSTEEIAIERALGYQEQKLLASQYAPNGLYNIEKHKAIILQATSSNKTEGEEGVKDFIVCENGRWFDGFKDEFNEDPIFDM